MFWRINWTTADGRARESGAINDADLVDTLAYIRRLPCGVRRGAMRTD